MPMKPYISDVTLKTHHGKHHRAYVDKTLEALLLGPLWVAGPAAVVLATLSGVAVVLLVLAIQSLT
jgi:Iron/manganese superoxide dismutases, alpha-hairpin domain